MHVPCTHTMIIDQNRRMIKVSQHFAWQDKKRFASLRICVSSLHRDHANLLCMLKRLFDTAIEVAVFQRLKLKYIKLQKALG